MQDDKFRFEKIDLERWIEDVHMELSRHYPNPLKLQNERGPIPGLFDKEALRLVLDGLVARVMGAVGIRNEIQITIENLENAVRIIVGSPHAQRLHLSGDVVSLPAAHELAEAHAGNLRIVERKGFCGYSLELQKILKI